ncbi:MAG: exodeoxyribonuclease III [Rhodospirillales bacterium]
MRIVTWNVNSVRQRVGHLERFVAARQPDVICLQEIKVVDELFPREALTALGYDHLEVHGQKSYNGVAIASRIPFEGVERKVFCDKDDRRHLSVLLPGGLELHNFYVPSGGPDPDREKNPKFAHKLDFLQEMADWASGEAIAKRKVLLVGDLNVAPLEHDVWNHKRLLRSVGHTPGESAAMALLRESGSFEDIPRRFTPEPEPLYSWWGYRFAQSVEKNYGWRLDHMLATPPLAGSVTALETYRDSRTWEKPSDHVPLIVDLA